MNFVKSLSFLIIALILQQTVVKLISIGNIRPDLVLVVLVAISLRYGTVVGLFSGLFIGIIQDVYAIETLGANALAKCLVGYFTGLFDEKVLKIMPATKIFFLGIAFFLHDLVYGFAVNLSWPVLAEALLRYSIPSAIYTLLLGALVFYFLIAPARTEP